VGPTTDLLLHVNLAPRGRVCSAVLRIDRRVSATPRAAK
jgi:hypothetical protein